MTYQTLVIVSQLVSMALFGSVLAGVLAYAFRPDNKERFERASRIPLEPDARDLTKGN